MIITKPIQEFQEITSTTPNKLITSPKINTSIYKKTV